ncbi:MAG: M16 family metallopeptidase [Sulfurifustis sp.]
MKQLPRTRIFAAGLWSAALLLLSGCNDVYDTTLDNGLRVVVKEDHRSPVVVSMVWYKIGSIDEPKGLTGISHVLEHMMFKGTERLKPNEFSRIIAENGGRENAFTTSDYTAYFQQLEKSRLPIAFDLEADRMQNLKLDEAEFSKEIQVVMEERRLRTEDQPESLVYEKFMSEAYGTHPYGHPVIGWMADLEQIKVNDLRDWYARWYRPNNAVLVVAGDVKPREVVELAKKYFGPIKPRPLDRPAIPPESPQQKMLRATVRAPAQVPYVLLGFHTPVLEPGKSRRMEESWEPYALSVLVGVLDGGDSARFERELVRDQKVASRIGGEYDAIARAPSVLLVSGSPVGERKTADLERAVRAQIERIKTERVTPAELERVKAQVVAGEVYRRDSVMAQAMQLGELAINGLDLSLLDERVKRLSAVTPEQIMQVAKKYLNEDNLTVVTLDPLPISGGKEKPALGGGSAHVR